MAVLRPRTAHSLAQTLPLSRGGASTTCHDIACAPAIWENPYLPSIRPPTLTGTVEAVNLDDKEWARSSSISAPRVGSFDILFVGGHEAVYAVAVEHPPPIPRPRCRPPHLSDACPHPSAGDSRAPRVARGRDGRAPHVQDVCGGRVDDARRARGRLRPHPRRRGRLESPRLTGPPRRRTTGRLPAGGCLRSPHPRGVLLLHGPRRAAARRAAARRAAARRAATRRAAPRL